MHLRTWNDEIMRLDNSTSDVLFHSFMLKRVVTQALRCDMHCGAAPGSDPPGKPKPASNRSRPHALYAQKTIPNNFHTKHFYAKQFLKKAAFTKQLLQQTAFAPNNVCTKHLFLLPTFIPSNFFTQLLHHPVWKTNFTPGSVCTNHARH